MHRDLPAMTDPIPIDQIRVLRLRELVHGDGYVIDPRAVADAVLRRESEVLRAVQPAACSKPLSGGAPGGRPVQLTPAPSATFPTHATTPAASAAPRRAGGTQTQSS